MGEIKTGRFEEITIRKIIGELDLNKFEKALEQYYSSTPTKHLIWDLRDAITTNLNYEQIKSIAALGMQYAHLRKNGKTALVCPHDFGHCRQIEIYLKASQVPYKIRSFMIMDDAAEWIGCCPSRLPVPE